MMKSTDLKDQATRIYKAAIRNGELIRPNECSKCKSDCIPHGHHPDYAKPLDVIWLCASCHAKEHGHGGAQEGAGRPRIVDNPKRTTIVLNKSDLDWLLSFAMNNALSGVSAAVRQLIEDRKIGTL